MDILTLQSSFVGWIAVFPFFFCTTIVPYIRWSFHKKRAFSVHRAVFYSLLVGYTVSTIALTLFPLPGECLPAESLFQGHLFQSIRATPLQHARLLHGGGPVTLNTFLATAHQNTAFRQVVFNILLFIPFGLLITYLRNTPGRTTLLLGCMFSLFLETQQLTGIRGLLDCSHRLFDIDDILLNTTGTALGLISMKHLHRHFPELQRRKTSLDEQHLQKRFCTWISNGTLRRCINGLLVFMYRMNFGTSDQLPGFFLISSLGTLMLLQILFPYVSHGNTFGHRITGTSLNAHHKRRILLHQTVVHLPSLFLVLMLTTSSFSGVVFFAFLTLLLLGGEYLPIVQSRGKSTQIENITGVTTHRNE